MNGKLNTANSYQKEIFKTIMEYIKNKENIDDIIIAKDMNQDITSKDIQEFYISIGVKDIYQTFNSISTN